MEDKIKKSQIKFHIDKIALLKKEIESRKSSGEKRIWQQQQELDAQIRRLEEQVRQHEAKINELSA